MKKFSLVYFLCLMFTLSISAQSGVQANSSYVVKGNTYVQIKSSKNQQTQTSFVWEDTKGEVYPIWINKSNGRCFIKKVSKKSGNEYNSYLPEEVSKDICMRLNISYTYKPKKNG